MQLAVAGFFEGFQHLVRARRSRVVQSCALIGSSSGMRRRAEDVSGRGEVRQMHAFGGGRERSADSCQTSSQVKLMMGASRRTSGLTDAPDGGLRRAAAA